MTRTGPGVEVLGTEQHACWANRVLPPVERLAGWQTRGLLVRHGDAPVTVVRRPAPSE